MVVYQDDDDVDDYVEYIYLAYVNTVSGYIKIIESSELNYQEALIELKEANNWYDSSS